MKHPQFKKPFFITAHAVDRFQERVANIPVAEIITLVQAGLQVPRKPLYSFRQKNGRLCKVYLLKYAGISYGAPVFRDKLEWPIVPTILGPEHIKRDLKSKEENHERKTPQYHT